MFVPIPFRARFRTEGVPSVTIALVVANLLVFALTCQGDDVFLTIKKGVVEGLGLSFARFSVLRLFSSMFLHGNLEHVVVNLIFLWAFGPTVEGRIGKPKFLALYLLAGLAGNLLHLATTGVVRPEVPLIGASGAIMGVAGAFLYALPHTSIEIFFWAFRVYFFEMRARWLLLIFFGLDILGALLSQGGDGVAHFAHLGGAAAGFLLMMAFRAERVSLEYADAERESDEHLGNYDVVALDHLAQLVERPTDNALMVESFVRRAADEYGGGRVAEAVAALHRHARLLADKGEPVPLAQTISSLSPSAGLLPPMLLMRLAVKLEPKNVGLATALYRRVYDQAPSSPDAEGALMRLAGISERTGDPRGAAGFYSEMLARFPHGSQALFARNALARLGYPVAPAG